MKITLERSHAGETLKGQSSLEAGVWPFNCCVCCKHCCMDVTTVCKHSTVNWFYCFVTGLLS